MRNKIAYACLVVCGMSIGYVTAVEVQAFPAWLAGTGSLKISTATLVIALLCPGSIGIALILLGGRKEFKIL